MEKRMVSIWFPHLLTDWMLRRQPDLRDAPFALVLQERGRRVVKAVNDLAQSRGVYVNMVVADCRALVPELQVFDYDAAQPEKLLNALAEWFIRYSPYVSVHLPDGLVLDASGCTHLWKGENEYLEDIQQRMKQFGYHSRCGMAGTVGAAWALSRYAPDDCIVNPGNCTKALSALPPAALRLDEVILDRLSRLGLNSIESFMNMPRTALRRRFGASLLTRLDQALGAELEIIDPVRPVAPYQERLPSLDPIRTAKGIEIALSTLLEELCKRLNRESKGLRKCELRCYRIDGLMKKISIGTSKPARNTAHLFKLFELKIRQIDPGLGIELFVLEATVVEDLESSQDALWAVSSGNQAAIAELMDRIEGKSGGASVRRYLPAEHYWPERSVKISLSLTEEPTIAWRQDLPRPMHLLSKPEPIEVTVPLPDYPPMLFRYRDVLHTVKKADGPERIEQEWWIQAGLYRDYYCVEDETGARYWLYRAGDYKSGDPKWFVHGFFA